jgi:hypothetical protein
MKNAFGLPYFQWHKGLIFNEGGKYLTFQCQWYYGKLVIIRLWISSMKYAHRELEIKLCLEKIR